MKQCKKCKKQYDVNPVYEMLIEQVKSQYIEVIDHHLETCVVCLSKDEKYLDYCEEVFYSTGIDICVY